MDLLIAGLLCILFIIIIGFMIFVKISTRIIGFVFTILLIVMILAFYSIGFLYNNILNLISLFYEEIYQREICYGIIFIL